jgi:hypothetical protein
LFKNHTWLPDGIFANQKYHFGIFWRDLERKMMEYLFSVHLEYFMAIWYILWPFGYVICCHWVSSRFGLLFQEKYGTPAFVLKNNCGNFFIGK